MTENEENVERTWLRDFNIVFWHQARAAIAFIWKQTKNALLVDAIHQGKLRAFLSEIDRKTEDLDAILVTHEHKDRIHGVGGFRRVNTPMHFGERWKRTLGVDASQKHIFEMGKMKT